MRFYFVLQPSVCVGGGRALLAGIHLRLAPAGPRRGHNPWFGPKVFAAGAGTFWSVIVPAGECWF